MERGAEEKEDFTEDQKARVKMLRLQDKVTGLLSKDMRVVLLLFIENN